MRIARLKRRCPECREQLIGIIQTQVLTDYPDRKRETTVWVCERCDLEFACVRGHGVTPI